MRHLSLPAWCACCLLSASASLPALGETICGPQWLEDLPPVDGTIYSVGKWDPDGAGPAGELLIVGGSFSTAGGVPAANIAAFDGDAWAPLGEGVNRVPRAYAVFQGDLIVAGEFSTAGGLAVNYVARWDGTSWSPLGNGLSMYVFSLAVYNDELYAGGWFTVDGTQSVARWDGVNWVPVGGGMRIAGCPGYCGTSVDALTVYNGELVAGGYFTQAGSASSANYIARWNGAQWNRLGGLNDEVTSLAVFNGQLIAGGRFSYANGVNHVAVWNGYAWAALGTGLDGTVMGLTMNNGHLFAGGYFWQTAAGYVAEWNGTAWTMLGAGMNSPVHGVSTYGGDVVAVGNFTVADGVSSTHWARWRDLPPPRIIQQPTGGPAIVDQDVHLAVTAASDNKLPLSYQWQKNGGPIFDDGHYSGTSTSQLTISDVQETDSGWYSVVVTDCKSTTSAAVWLSVVCPLSVSAPSPAFPKSVYVGETVTTSVTASGAIGEPRFAWRRNGAALSDDSHISGSASASLTLSPVGMRDAGRYDVVVIDDCGSVTSASTTLSVLCPAAVLADLDRDCDVDANDLTLFLACSSGPGVPAVIGAGCPASRINQNRAVADFDADWDVDQSDFGVFQRCSGASNVPADPSCDD